MIFEYKELKECVKEDFDTFYGEMNFTEFQVIPAILNEYEHGEGFNITEEICIYLFLSQIYKEEGIDRTTLNKKLFELLSNKKNIDIIKNDLKDEYIKFEKDLEELE